MLSQYGFARENAVWLGFLRCSCFRYASGGNPQSQLDIGLRGKRRKCLTAYEDGIVLIGTGTVVGCWLLRHKLATQDTVLATLDRLQQQDRERGHRQSPENDSQCRFVQEWLAAERSSGCSGL